MYIYALKKQGAAAVLERLVESKSIVDSVGKHLYHGIMCLQPVSQLVPRYDCENIGGS